MRGEPPATDARPLDQISLTLRKNAVTRITKQPPLCASPGSTISPSNGGEELAVRLCAARPSRRRSPSSARRSLWRTRLGAQARWRRESATEIANRLRTSGFVVEGIRGRRDENRLRTRRRACRSNWGRRRAICRLLRAVGEQHRAVQASAIADYHINHSVLGGNSAASVSTLRSPESFSARLSRWPSRRHWKPSGGTWKVEVNNNASWSSSCNRPDMKPRSRNGGTPPAIPIIV